MNTIEERATNDINIGAVLLTLGHKILRVDKANPKRVIFFFEFEESIEEAIDKYFRHELKCDPFELMTNIRLLKNMINN